MKKLLSLLIAFVFLNVESQAYYPSYGGLGLNPVGTYGGTMVPSTDSTATTGNVSSAASIGLFSIGVPQVGLATGNFALFIQGGSYTGDIVGYVDPTSQTLSAILSGASTFTVAIPYYTISGTPPNQTETVTFKDYSIAATGNMEATFSQGAQSSGIGQTVLLSGTAEIISFIFVDGNGAPEPTATQTFLVNGVQQSGSVQPSPITLQTSGAS